MRKNLLTKFGSFLCCILLSSNLSARDLVYVIDGFRYTVNNNKTVAFVGVESSAESELSEIVIPSTVSIQVTPNDKEDYQVTEIGSYAFILCKKLTSVVIPEGVTKIGEYAFVDCQALTDITIPTSVTTIGERAFLGTEWYEKKIPDGLVYINSMVYSYKGEMPENTTLSIKEGTVSIASAAFFECKNLTSISLPSSLKRIDAYAFNNCEKLSKIALPENLEYIGTSAFDQTALEILTVPASVKYMGLGVQPQTIRFEGITPPNTTPQYNMYQYHTKRTFFVPFQSFAAYYETELIPLGTDKLHSMTVKALEDSKEIYAVTVKIGNSDGWGEMAGKVTINGNEGPIIGINEGNKMEINVLAKENITLIDQIQINDEEPIILENQTSFAHTIQSTVAEPYLINVNFKDKQMASISDQTMDGIRVYASEKMIEIENANETTPITILNLAGQSVYQGTTDNYEAISLPSGMYIVKVSTETHKIVIK